jgi:hypothetical protein
MKPTTPIKAATAVLLAAGVFCASAANAASVSYFLDQSNLSALADGTNYLKVTISDGIGGLIDFKVETLAPLNSIADSNFGIQDFTFNTTLANPSLDSVIVNLPLGWTGDATSPPLKQADGFGKFEFDVSNGGSNRLSTLTFSVNVASDSINDYYELSSGTAGEGNVQFAALVGGFTNQCTIAHPCTGAHFGGGTPVPVPPAIWLFGSGLLGMAVVARRKMFS